MTDRASKPSCKSYFDGLYEGDAEKLGAIFHPSADLRWLEKGELQVLTVPDWLDRVRKRPSAKAEGKPREDFIVTIDRSDDQTAFIKVRCQLPPRYFTDYLVAMKLPTAGRSSRNPTATICASNPSAARRSRRR